MIESSQSTGSEKINNKAKIPFNNGNPVPEGISAEDFHAAASIVAKENSITPRGIHKKGPTYFEKIYKETAKRWVELSKRISDRKAGKVFSKKELSGYITATDVEESEKETKDFIERYRNERDHPQRPLN